MKKWYASKTVWINVVSAVIAVALYASDSGLFGVDPEAYVAALAILNIILRFLTDSGVERSVT